MNFTSFSGFRKTLGPGLIMAAAAIGVSHLVQSTRAGAEFGFALVWAVVLANIFKYPFLEYGPRYALATGRDMIRGYASLSPAAIWIYTIFTISTMFAIQAAVTIVTGSLAGSLTGIDLPVTTWSGIILVLCVMLLIRDRYSVLDRAIKLIMLIFSISTLIAIGTAISMAEYHPDPSFIAPDIWTVSGVAFLIALMGWMPIPIDAAAWHSVWSVERAKQTGYKPKLNEALSDFNIGYIGASLIALAFLTLGALVMFGSGEDYASSAAAFSQQFVSLYTLTLGEWSSLIIIICAFTTMFSTTLTVTDTYPRILTHISATLRGESNGYSTSLYRFLLVGVSGCSFLFLLFLGDRFRFLIDLATTLSFLTAPALAFINHKLIHQPEVPEEMRPRPWLYWLSISGIIFLTLFALLYVYWVIRF